MHRQNNGFIDPHVLHAATHVVVPSAIPQDFGIENNIFRNIFHYDFQLHQLVKRLNLEKTSTTNETKETNKQTKQTNKQKSHSTVEAFILLSASNGRKRAFADKIHFGAISKTT